MSFKFTLRNVNTDKIDQKYGIGIPSNIAEDVEVPENVTKISDLLSSCRAINNKTISFFDETKNLRKCNISMIDFQTNKDLNSSQSGYCCFWCRNKIESAPLGCPISFVSNVAVKKYRSEISKDIYTIREVSLSRSPAPDPSHFFYFFCRTF
jgi:hypothetical protein